MQALCVVGGAPLRGCVAIHGAKNSVLPILAATILCRNPCVLHNCPDIDDVDVALQILRSLGCKVTRNGCSICVDPSPMNYRIVSPELSEKMRSSIVFLGAIASRMQGAQISLPGGCPLGERPIDLHLSALESLGMQFSFEDKKILCTATNLHAAEISFPFPSVGATENALLAAVGCKGTTTIYHAAREPEITDLIGFLRSAGAKIEGAGTSVLKVEGGHALHGTTYTIMPDRIETATYLCACAGCSGEICLQRTNAQMLLPVIARLRHCGCSVECTGNEIRMRADGPLQSAGQIITQPYPGFPTDAQALMTAALLRAEGKSVIRETIFENRFRYVHQLQKLGAKIVLHENEVQIEKASALHAAQMQAEDLRAGAALVIAALQAEGKSVITGVKHIDRGYDKIEENLCRLGADIKCVEID